MSTGGKHYIPRPDAGFNAWRTNFVQYVTSHFFEIGLTEEQVATLSAAAIAWGKEYAAHVAAQAAAESARSKKDAARAALEQVIRPYVRIIQAHSGVTDGMRAGMGIAVKDAGLASEELGRGDGGAPGGNGALNGGVPVARVEQGGRLTHVVRYSDSATPTRRAKPRWAMGVELRRALVPVGADVAGDPETMEFLGLVTSGQATTTFALEDAGKTAVYVLRWVAAGGAVSAWSVPATATVAA